MSSFVTLTELQITGPLMHAREPGRKAAVKRAMVAKLSLIVLILAGHVYSAKGHELNSTPFRPAEVLLKQGLELVDHDRFDEAIAIFRKAIAIAPGYLRAHVEYIRTQSYFLEAYNDVRIEYEALMANEPDNPIYPIALVLGAGNATSNRINRARYEKVVALAPDWMWGHYAKLNCLAKTPEAAAVQLLKAIEKDPTASEPYKI